MDFDLLIPMLHYFSYKNNLYNLESSSHSIVLTLNYNVTLYPTQTLVVLFHDR